MKKLIRVIYIQERDEEGHFTSTKTPIIVIGNTIGIVDVWFIYFLLITIYIFILIKVL